MERKFPGVRTDAFVVMPNHIHGIIITGPNDTNVNNMNIDEIDENAPVGANVPIRPRRGDAEFGAGGVDSVANATDLRVRFNASLSDIIQWFKIMTTNEYIRGVKHSGWPPFRKRVWQRGYYEHIIRDDESLARIRHYIADNPARWAEDDENLQKRKAP